jgi:hypothetical protein
LSHNRPQTILLAHVIGSGAGALLAADRCQAGVEQIAEEFPARRRFEALDPELGGDVIGGGAGGHRPHNPGKSRGMHGARTACAARTARESEGVTN